MGGKRILIKKNVGPGGIYDLYVEDQDGVPVRIWVLNKVGKALRKRLEKRK